MILTILIALFSLIALLVIHEFGHFILAKKFGTKIEEFGVGYPPRIIGKKIGETIYSLNLIPFGAFVKIHGEAGGVEDYRSFTDKPLWQRFLIIIGGVVSFWIVSAVLLGVASATWGLPQAVSDEENYNLKEVKIQITQIMSDSPAQAADFQAGDVIIGFEKVADVQSFIAANKGKEITLTVKRGQDFLEKKIVPRESYPAETGPMGVALARIALKHYSWFSAPWQGITISAGMTANIIRGWIAGIKNVLGIAKLPSGLKMEMFGPIGILDLLGQYSKMGVSYFFFLVSYISVAMALTNILPIPALDGGKIVFLAIEGLRRGKPLNYKIEQNITATFFVLLIIFMIFVTVKFDIPRIF
ncbi:MAG: M50 family metallopeptidase [Candidatus Nealsonbacteria bacterium]